MVYIYKKTIHGRPYYYLRVSKRVEGKLVVKDIAYLGKNIAEVKKNLDNLPRYQKDIRKGYKGIKRLIESDYYLEKIKSKKIKSDPFIERELLEKIEAIKLHFNSRFLKIHNETITEVYKEFIIDFAYNTASIEGNTITLEEAGKLLADEILPKDRTLREVYDLQNTEKVFFWLIDKRPNFNENLIVRIHEKLLDRIDKRKGYRNHDIRVFRSRFEASPARYVKTDMTLLMKWLEDNKKKLHPFVLASIFHHKFVKIHPFSDGNGRTGRMIMNYIMMRRKYPPVIISKRFRKEYLDALTEADESEIRTQEPKHYKALIKHVAQELISSYWNIFNI